MLFWSIGVVFNTGRLYTKTEMAEHYKAHRSEFNDAINIIDQITAPARVSIEFEKGRVEIFHTRINEKYGSNWPNRNQEEVDSIARSIDLSMDDLSMIEDALKETGCIGYNNMRQASRTFSFSRAGMGMYSYVLFSEAMSDSLQATFNDSCIHVAYNNQVVFEYGGGAIGPQCFGDYFFDK